MLAYRDVTVGETGYRPNPRERLRLSSRRPRSIGRTTPEERASVCCGPASPPRHRDEDCENASRLRFECITLRHLTRSSFEIVALTQADCFTELLPDQISGLSLSANNRPGLFRVARGVFHSCFLRRISALVRIFSVSTDQRINTVYTLMHIHGAEGISWMVVGGALATRERPMEEFRAASVCVRCPEAGVNFFFAGTPRVRCS